MAETHRGFFAWLQDNARILLSIALVLFLLFAVYSYSKRTEGGQSTLADVSTEETSEDVTLDADIADIITGEEDGDTVVAVADSKDAMAKPAADNDIKKDTQENKEQQAEKIVIEHKEGSIVVTAQRGEGMTHLARRAAAEYIAQNKIKGMTPAHKVYIEDYLRRTIASQRVHASTSVDFSNASIEAAIEKASTLSAAQLANLARYAQRVPALQ